MLQVEHKHIADMLVTQPWHEQRDFAKRTQNHTKGQAIIAHVAITNNSGGDSPNNDARVIGRGSYCWPAKLLTGEERRLQHGKWPQRKQGEENNLGKMQGQLYLVHRVS